MLNHPSRGFTIVELLIVIIVIAILASASVIAYNGIQMRAIDARMTSAANKIEKALRLHNIETGEQPHGGWTSLGASASPVTNGSCPDSSRASGWLGSGNYPCSVEDILVSSKYLDQGYVNSLPSNNNYSNHTGRYSFMLYQCGADDSDKYGLYWHLRNPTSEDTAKFDSVRSECGTGVSVRDSYGMRAGAIIDLS